MAAFSVPAFQGELAHLHICRTTPFLFGHGIWFALLCWKLRGFSAADATGMREFRRFQRALPMPNCALRWAASRRAAIGTR